MTPEERAVHWANQVISDCLAEANGDVTAALAAAEYIVATQPIPEDIELSIDAALASSPWVAYEGRRGGHGWKHTRTGEIVYQAERPGGRTAGKRGTAAAKRGRAAIKRSKAARRAAKTRKMKKAALIAAQRRKQQPTVAKRLSGAKTAVAKLGIKAWERMEPAARTSVAVAYSIAKGIFRVFKVWAFVNATPLRWGRQIALHIAKERGCTDEQIVNINKTVRMIDNVMTMPLLPSISTLTSIKQAVEAGANAIGADPVLDYIERGIEKASAVIGIPEAVNSVKELGESLGLSGQQFTQLAITVSNAASEAVDVAFKIGKSVREAGESVADFAKRMGVKGIDLGKMAESIKQQVSKTFEGTEFLELLKGLGVSAEQIGQSKDAILKTAKSLVNVVDKTAGQIASAARAVGIPEAFDTIKKAVKAVGNKMLPSPWAPYSRVAEGLAYTLGPAAVKSAIVSSISPFAMFIPGAALSYIAYSAVRNPIKSIRGARKAIEQIAKQVRAAAKDPFATIKQVAREGSGVKVQIGEQLLSLDVSQAFAITEEQQLSLVTKIVDRMKAAGDKSDWYMALLSAALDVHDQDIQSAIVMADKAFATNPHSASLSMDERTYLSIIAFAQERGVGEKWQGPSGRWFTKKPSGHVVPTAAPDGSHPDKRWPEKEEEDAGRKEGDKPSNARGREGDTRRSEPSSAGVEETSSRSGDSSASDARGSRDKPASSQTTGDTGREGQGVNASLRVSRIRRRLSRYADHFRSSDRKQISELLDAVSEHIKEVGADAAAAALGEDRHGRVKKVQYRSTAGFNEKSKDVRFLREYLDSTGIVLQGYRGKLDPKLPLITSAPVPSARKEARSGDVVPIPINLETKLEESQYIPGLESTEDLERIVGAPVKQFTRRVVKKLDRKYGRGKWIVKSYGDESFAGFGIFFPERLAAIQQSAKESIWSVASQLKPLGYSLLQEGGTTVGIKDKSGTTYRFGTPDFNSIKEIEVRRLAKIASVSAQSENGAVLPASPAEAFAQDYGVTLRRAESTDGKKGKIIGITDAEGNDVDFNTPQWRTQIAATSKKDNGEFKHDLDRAIAAINNPAQQVRFMAQPAFEAVGVTEEDRAEGLTWETSHEGRVHVTVKNGKASVVPYATLAGRSDSLPVVFPNDDIKAMEAAAQEAIDALPEGERTNRVFAPDVMKTKDGWRVVELNASAEEGSSLWLEENPFVIDAYISHITNREPQHVRFVRRLLKDKILGKAPGLFGRLGIRRKRKPVEPEKAKPALSIEETSDARRINSSISHGRTRIGRIGYERSVFALLTDSV